MDMRELQQAIVAEMGVVSEIDPEAEAERRVAFLSSYLAATGALPVEPLPVTN